MKNMLVAAVAAVALPFLAIAIFAISFFVAFGKQRESEAKEREQYYSQE